MSIFFCNFVGFLFARSARGCAGSRNHAREIHDIRKLRQMRRHIVAVVLMMATIVVRAQDAKLTGTVIGSSPSVEYVNFTATTTQNLPKDAFDGDMGTYFASYDRSNTWVGLDLGERYVVTKVGWSPRNDGNGPKRVQLAVFEGANREDFMDAMPLYVNDKKGTIGKMDYADVDCSLGFRYVRYIGPNDARCNVAEVEFYGHKGEGDSSKLYRPTNLPCVVIHTKDGVEPWDKETYIESIVAIIGADGKLLQDTAGVRLRGNASMGFPKKPYRIKFNHKHKVLGSPAKAKNWVLVNNYGDKTLMRNIVAFHVSEVMEMPYTPFIQAVDVLVNGEYKGCYQLSDKIEVKKGRVEVQEMAPEDVSGEALSGGYLWEVDSYAYTEQVYFYTNKGIGITVHYPKDDEIQEAQLSYIHDFCQALENRAYKASAYNTSWREYVDYSTFARYFLINQLCGNPDLYWSMYMYKQRGDQKAYTGPVWDFDIAFDNDNRIYPLKNATDYTYGIAGESATFAKKILFADQQAKDEMLELWHVMRNHGITAEKLTEYVDQVAEELEQSQRLNFIRWPILSQYVHQNPVALGSFSAEVERLKAYLEMRVEWMDRKLGYTWHELDVPDAVENVGADVKGYRVYDLFGRLIYAGEKMPDLKEGIYIIQHNNQTTKLLQ